MKHFYIFIPIILIALKGRSQTTTLEDMFQAGAPDSIYSWAKQAVVEEDGPADITNTIEIVNFLLAQYVHKIEKPYDRKNLFKRVDKIDSFKTQKFLTIVPAITIISDTLRAPVNYLLKNYFSPMEKYIPLVMDSCILGALNTFLAVKNAHTGYVEDAVERAAFLSSAFYSMMPRQVQRRKPNGALEKLWAVDYTLQVKKIVFSNTYKKAKVYLSYENMLQQIILLEKKNGGWVYTSTESSMII